LEANSSNKNEASLGKKCYNSNAVTTEGKTVQKEEKNISMT
jgi:hypothetical protein